MKKLFHNIGNKGFKYSENKLTENSLFNNYIAKKNFAFMFPSRSLKVPQEIKEGKNLSEEELKKAAKKEHKEKLRANNYESKFNLDPNDLDDYIIIGKEVFKNKYKEALIKKQKKEITNEEFKKILDNDEALNLDPNLLKYEEVGNSKQLFRRPFYHGSNLDQMHMFAIPKDDKIEPYNSQEMFKFSAPENDFQKLKSLIYNRNKHISGFLPPFELSNEKLEEIYIQLKAIKHKYKIDLNSEEDIHRIVNDSYSKPLESVYIKDKSNTEYLQLYLKIQNNLLEEIQNNLSIKVIPNLLMKFVFDLGFNDKSFWIILEQIILDNLHHYSVNDLTKIFFVITYACPKFTSDLFRNIIYDEIFKQVENLSFDEMLHVLAGCRESKNKKIYDKLANIIIDKKDKLLIAQADRGNAIAKLIYTYALHKPRKYGVNTQVPQKDLVEKFIRAFENDLMETILKMNARELAWIANSLYLLRLENVEIFTK